MHILSWRIAMSSVFMRINTRFSLLLFIWPFGRTNPDCWYNPSHVVAAAEKPHIAFQEYTNYSVHRTLRSKYEFIESKHPDKWAQTLSLVVYCMQVKWPHKKPLTNNPISDCHASLTSVWISARGF
jgi:hypothetical protein